MHGEFAPALTLSQVQFAPARYLLTRVKEWLAATNPTCLLHPHGFWVVLLHRSEGQDWRFHFWPSGRRHITGMPALIHTHDKIVESKILHGELLNVVYEVDEGPSAELHIYEVQYLGDKYTGSTTNALEKTSRRGTARVKLRQTMKTGECYRVEAHLYHEVVVSQAASAATIVLMHSFSPGAVKVLGLDGYPERIEFQRQGRCAEELLQRMHENLDTSGKAAASEAMTGQMAYWRAGMEECATGWLVGRVRLACRHHADALRRLSQRHRFML